MFQSSIALSGNTGSVQQLRAAMKSYHFHPITLVIIGMTALLKALGYMPMEFTPLGRSLDILSYCLRMALYLGVAIWLLPYVIRRGMLRNIPFALTSLCFLLVAIKEWVMQGSPAMRSKAGGRHGVGSFPVFSVIGGGRRPARARQPSAR